MAARNPNQDRRDRNVEEPGDLNAADIVGPTGEEMPRQSHDGVESDDPARPAPSDGDEDADTTAIRSGATD